MVFGIVILLMLAAIAFFHYIQGFFSSAISAVLSIVAAVIALAYHETLTEGLLLGVAPDWMPALVILGLYALTYVILRTLFDKLIPGQIQLPAVMDKVGGAAMGVVAGVFGLGVVAVAAQQMPFGTSVGGYVRYPTSDRTVTVPGAGSGGSIARSKDGSTFNEVEGDTFDPEKEKKMLIPVDDVLVATVEHLSDKGSLSAAKPFRSVHPDYLTELFGQRVGIQGTVQRTIINNPEKNQLGVELSGVYAAPPIAPTQIFDHEMKRIRGTPVKVPAPAPDEVRVVVRVKFDVTAAEAKDKLVRLSPGSVRLVTKRPDELGVNPEPDWHNYFPIGTLEANGLMYAHKIDDFLIVAAPGKKVTGGDAPAEVDFVFQVKREGFLPPTTDKDPEPQIQSGTFLEVKKLGRLDLAAGDKGKLKPYKPLTVIAIKRKRLDLEGGPKPLEPGQGTSVTLGGQAPTGPPVIGAGGGGGELGKRLAGVWKGGTAVTGGVETLTFAADGAMTSDKGGTSTPMRWVVSGPPQGETLTIKTGPAGTDPATGEQRTIVFEDENQFSMTDGAGTRRFAREGSLAAAAAAPPPEAPKVISGPDWAVSRMTGMWGSPDGMWYTFRADGSYTVADATRKAEGNWKVTKVDGEYVEIELKTQAGKLATQRWRLLGVRDNQIVRYDTEVPVEYTRKS